MNKFFSDIRRRLGLVKPTRWVRFGIVSVIFFLWVFWMRSPWLILLWLLLADIYLLGYIPFTWWKKSKNKAVRTVMGWVDAIVYALVLVYFIFAFIGQNYQIPSSSLEKTLLTGDYLWVNKVIYGPRVPMTPVNFPLVHNKMPLLGCDSYLDSPSVGYKRLKGLRKVETGDIVVFNFPAGDTVAARYEETPEYWDILVDHYGRDFIAAHPEQFGRIKYRPVDRRQNFVKRAVGLPGQNIRIAADTIYIDGQAQAWPENVQFNYIVAATRTLDEDYLHELGVTPSDANLLNYSPVDRQNLSAWLPAAATSPLLYIMPLTREMIARMQKDGRIDGIIKMNEVFRITGADLHLFPKGLSDEWTLADYGGTAGITIPAKGMTVPMNAATWAVYNRCIRNYEGHTDSWLAPDGTVYIDGKPAREYTFAMDYYFMMGDNRDMSQDSRFWGFVPEDHIVGSPFIVLISFDKDRSLFNGGIRWNRILRTANPDHL